MKIWIVESSGVVGAAKCCEIEADSVEDAFKLINEDEAEVEWFSLTELYGPSLYD